MKNKYINQCRYNAPNALYYEQVYILTRRITMKSTIRILGICLILAGVFLLAYEGFTYTKHEEVAQIGNVHITENTQETVYFPPIVGGISIVAGIVLLAVSRKNQ
jgi:hypothetical protein